jgi:hypothetical protein
MADGAVQPAIGSDVLGATSPADPLTLKFIRDQIGKRLVRDAAIFRESPTSISLRKAGANVYLPAGKTALRGVSQDMAGDLAELESQLNAEPDKKTG